MRHRLRSEIRHNDRDMPNTRNHRIRSIEAALESETGMCMHIRHDRQAALSAYRPQLCEGIRMQNADARVVGTRI
jgi:hypothetical protein